MEQTYLNIAAKQFDVAKEIADSHDLFFAINTICGSASKRMPRRDFSTLMGKATNALLSTPGLNLFSDKGDGTVALYGAYVYTWAERGGHRPVESTAVGPQSPAPQPAEEAKPSIIKSAEEPKPAEPRPAGLQLLRFGLPVVAAGVCFAVVIGASSTRSSK